MGYLLLGRYRVARLLIVAQVRELVTLVNLSLAYDPAEMISSFAHYSAAPTADNLYDLNLEIIYPIAIIMVVISLAISEVSIPRLATRTYHKK